MARIFEVPPLAVFYGPGPEDQPADLETLQAQMDEAQENVDRIQKVLDSVGSAYAVAYAQLQITANQMNDTAATHAPESNDPPDQARVDSPRYRLDLTKTLKLPPTSKDLRPPGDPGPPPRADNA